MSVFALALARYLTAQGHGTFDGLGTRSDIYVGRQPPKSPANIIMVNPTGGVPVLAGGTRPYDEPTVQLLVRSACREDAAGLRRAQGLYDALHGLHNVTMDATGDDPVYVVRVLAQQSAPISAGVDGEGRSLWSINLAARVRNSTAHRSLV
jgi:hypothetical protein